MKSDFSDSYELRRIILFGASSSSSLIFVFLFLQFISYHQVFNVPVVAEMLMYAEFFLFAYASYFLVSILVWKYTTGLAKYFPSWVPICFLGSALFCVSFFSRVYIADVLYYQEGDPFRSPPGPVSVIILGTAMSIAILTVVVSIPTVLIASLYSVFGQKGD